MSDFPKASIAYSVATDVNQDHLLIERVARVIMSAAMDGDSEIDFKLSPLLDEDKRERLKAKLRKAGYNVTMVGYTKVHAGHTVSHANHPLIRISWAHAGE